MIKTQEHKLFITSCFVAHHKTDNNDRLIKEIYRIANSSSSNGKSNQGGYQSFPYSFPNFDNKIIENMFLKTIQPTAKNIMNNWGLHNINMDRYCYWYNINYKYSYNNPHVHPDSYLSGVYYIQVPSNSGKIVFERSTSERDRMVHQTRQIIKNNIKVNNPCINNEYCFTPKEGMLILFPGHLSHYVQQNLTDEEKQDRISLSFNFF